jgi:hypothetical protein
MYDSQCPQIFPAVAGDYEEYSENISKGTL